MVKEMTWAEMSVQPVAVPRVPVSSSPRTGSDRRRAVPDCPAGASGMRPASTMICGRTGSGVLTGSSLRCDNRRVDEWAAFVKARLDEDEAAANEVHRPRDCGSVDRDGAFDPDPIWCSCDYPARALRDVEAGRRILARHSPAEGIAVAGPCCTWCSDDTD